MDLVQGGGRRPPVEDLHGIGCYETECSTPAGLGDAHQVPAQRLDVIGRVHSLTCVFDRRIDRGLLDVVVRAEAEIVVLLFAEAYTQRR